MENPKKRVTFLDDNQNQMSSSKRSGLDRRHDSCEGFAYVSTVGWICRREKTRRETDAEEG